MKLRWMGISGVMLVLAALILGSLGPLLLPSAFGSTTYNGMMGPGMMNGGGMMEQGAVNDINQSFDQRFLDQMIMHHQGAVMSAQIMIADSARPELRDLAQRITTAQQRDIDQMRQWRQEWYSTAGAVPAPGMMGGMMNRSQIRQMMGASVDFIACSSR